MSEKIDFFKLPIPKSYGDAIFGIYHVVINDESPTLAKFASLPNSTKLQIKDLICKMATIKNYKTPEIKYSLHGYDFGEIRPKPHRFFFFQKCGNNYIFFDYVLKKTDSLSDEFYKRLEKKKIKYEEEFKRFIERSK